MGVVIFFLQPETARLLLSQVRATDFLRRRPRGLTGADPWDRSGHLRQGAGTAQVFPILYSLPKQSGLCLLCVELCVPHSLFNVIKPSCLAEMYG